jgi:hypothetical protein
LAFGLWLFGGWQTQHIIKRDEKFLYELNNNKTLANQLSTNG